MTFICYVFTLPNSFIPLRIKIINFEFNLYYKSDLENIYVQEMWKNLTDKILSIVLQIIISFKWET